MYTYYHMVAISACLGQGQKSTAEFLLADRHRTVQRTGGNQEGAERNSYPQKRTLLARRSLS